MVRIARTSVKGVPISVTSSGIERMQRIVYYTARVLTGWHYTSLRFAAREPERGKSFHFI